MSTHSKRFALLDEARYTTVNITAALAQRIPGSHSFLWDRATVLRTFIARLMRIA